MISEDGELSFRKQAWDYFATHASQRMSIFNFYIALSSALLTAYFSSFKDDAHFKSARPGLAFLLCFLAFVFWKLDQRTGFLIKNSEDALKYFESSHEVPAVVRVFTEEESRTDARKVRGWRAVFFWRHHLSYSTCFRLVYLSFSAVGLAGLATWAAPFVLRAIKRLMCGCP